MAYEIQRVERDRNGIPGLFTDLVSKNRRRIFERAKELNGRGQQCRVVDSRGHVLDGKEMQELDR